MKPSTIGVFSMWRASARRELEGKGRRSPQGHFSFFSAKSGMSVDEANFTFFSDLVLAEAVLGRPVKPGRDGLVWGEVSKMVLARELL